MKIFMVALVCCAAVASAQEGNSEAAGPHSSSYIYDLTKRPLNAKEVRVLMEKGAGQWPVINELPADLTFDCSNKKGFYADEKYQCQVFHRCDISGKLNSFVCVNTTVFNQLTLVCDYWFNVECSRSGEFREFANSRLYTDKKLFDNAEVTDSPGPGNDFLAPQGIVEAPTGDPAEPIAAPLPIQSFQPGVSPGPINVGGWVSFTSPPDEIVFDTLNPNKFSSNAEATTAAPEETTAAAEETTAAAEEEANAAVEMTNAAASAEETSAVAEETTAAAAE